ncbi:unnamed protein product [Trichobilharzia szidati]|nr:unnamed protein product [Trichobilharzia szidati]
MDHIIWIMWIPFLLLSRQNYGDAVQLLQSSSLPPSATKTVEYSSTNQTVSEGEQITLHCVPDSNTNFLIWYFTPMIRVTNTSDENSMSSTFTSMDLQSDNLSRANETTDDETIELAVCKPQVTCKEQTHLVDIQVYPTGVLTVTNAQSRHSGNYQCAILAGVKTITMRRYLVVEVPPKKPVITLSHKYPLNGSEQLEMQKYLLEGDYLNLTCQSLQGFPSPQLIWSFNPIRNNSGLSMTSIISQQTSVNTPEWIHTKEDMKQSSYHTSIIPYGMTLSLISLQVSRSYDGMKIKCKAVNKVGSSISDDYEVSVRYAPVILNFSEDPWIVLYEEQSYTQCRAEGNPPPAVYWMDQHGRRISKTNILNSAVLIETLFKEEVHRLAKDNWRTNVSCYASSPMGSTQRTLSVEFYFAPIVTTNEVVYVRIGESVRLSCKAISNPPPTNVFWYRKSDQRSSVSLQSSKPSEKLFKVTNNYSPLYVDNYTLDTDRTHWSSPVLQINSVTIDDAGVYGCAAENDIHIRGLDTYSYRRESESHLFVYYPPGKPTIRTISRSQSDDNLYVRLQCVQNTRSPGLPAPSVKWMWIPQSCKTMKSSSSNSLSPLPIKPKTIEYEDQILINLTDLHIDGLYYCEMKNEVGNAISEPTNITVHESPQIVEGPNLEHIMNPSFNFNSSPRLRCVAHGKPAPHITWLHNNAVISTSRVPSSNDHLCSWKKVQTNVRCIGLETGSYTWETTSELIWEPILPSSYSHTGEVNARDSNETKRFQSTCQSFEIANEGIYTCQATNDYGVEYSNSVQMVLKYPPVLIHQTISKHALRDTDSKQKSSPIIVQKATFHQDNENKVDMLTCAFKANPEPNQISWYYIPSHRVSVLLRRAEKNPLMTQSCDAKYDKQIKPIAFYQSDYSEINKSPKENFKIDLKSGKEAEMALKDYADVNFTYSDTLYLTSLIITGSNMTNLGAYIANIENAEGCRQCTVILQKPSKPESPTDIRIEEVTWDQVTLTWVVGFNGGYDQTIILEFTEIQTLSKQDSMQLDNQRKVRITGIPKLQIQQRCQISGLTPNTKYKFVVYAESILGQGTKSKEFTIITKAINFPKLITSNHETNLINLQFSSPNDSQSFCMKTEYSLLNRINWSTLIDTCQVNDRTVLPLKINRNILSDLRVSVENIPLSGGKGRLVRELQTHSIYRTQKSLSTYKSNNNKHENVLKHENSQANSDDPNSSDISKKFKSPRREALILHNFTNYENSLNKTILGSMDNSHQSVALQMDQNFAYRVWTCLKNQTFICYQAKSFPEVSEINPINNKFRSKLGWIVVAILIVLFLCCGILTLIHVYRRRSANRVIVPTLHDKDKSSIRKCTTSPEKAAENGHMLPLNSSFSRQMTGTPTNFKVSTSSLAISQSTFSTPTKVITFNCDTANTQIPLVTFTSEMPNSLLKASNIEISPAIIEYRPQPIDMCPHSTNSYTLPSNCSFIPISSQDRLCTNENLSTIPADCVVNSSSILIIPANTFPSVTFQCST